MKKILAVLAVFALIFSIAACSKSGGKNNDNTDETLPFDVDELATMNSEEMSSFVEENSSVLESFSEANKVLTPQDIMDDIDKNGYLPDEYITLKRADLLDYFGLGADVVRDCAVIMDSSGYKDEIIILKATADFNVDSIKETLENYLEGKKEEMRDYDATQYAILEKCSVTVKDDYVALFISEHQKEINKIFDSYF